jgi:D-threo-aldose 1-dehydrogenase
VIGARRIAGTSIELSELSFGGAGIGNLYSSVSEDDARSALDEAWLGGVRYFDTAPHYGLGLSERRIGKALSNRPRGDFVVSTKVGRLLEPNPRPSDRDNDIFEVPGNLVRRWDFSRDGILRSVEASLERLQLDRIDVLYLHDPDESGIPDAAETGAEALIELRDQGIVSAVGIGSNDAQAIADAFLASDIDLAMVAGRYTLIEQHGAEAIFEAAGSRSIVAAGVFSSGLLATDRPKADATYNYAKASKHILDEARRLADLAESFGVTLPASALNFALRDPRVASVTIGMRSALEVTQNLALLRTDIPSDFWERARG